MTEQKEMGIVGKALKGLRICVGANDLSKTASSTKTDEEAQEIESRVEEMCAGCPYSRGACGGSECCDSALMKDALAAMELLTGEEKQKEDGEQVADGVTAFVAMQDANHYQVSGSYRDLLLMMEFCAEQLVAQGANRDCVMNMVDNYMEIAEGCERHGKQGTV